MARFFIFLVIILSACTNVITPASSPSEVPLLIGKTWYVSLDGNDTNPGTFAEPLQHVQACLDRVQPGDTCEIMAGTYYESLNLRNSGTEKARITIRNYSGQIVTVNSGDGKTLLTGGRIHYYTIEGLRFIANQNSSGAGDYTINFGANIWDGETNKDGGNNGFILRDCYVEGAVKFYGHDNLVENCELNGLGKFPNGIQERFAPSHDNIYRNNVIHDYTTRGVWAMKRTQNTLIEGNLIFNTGLAGVDCDGATFPVYNCDVLNNIIHDSSRYGIEFENGFDGSSAVGNIIYNVRQGVSVINYGVGYTDGNLEYRMLDTGILIQDNTIRDTHHDGIVCHAAPGVIVTGNTLIRTNTDRSWFGSIGLVPLSGYPCNNWIITGNVIAPTGVALHVEGNPSGVVSNYNHYGFLASEKKFVWKTEFDTYYTLEEWQSIRGFDLDSTFGGVVLPSNTPATFAPNTKLP